MRNCINSHRKQEGANRQRGEKLLRTTETLGGLKDGIWLLLRVLGCIDDGHFEDAMVFATAPTWPSSSVGNERQLNVVLTIARFHPTKMPLRERIISAPSIFLATYGNNWWTIFRKYVSSFFKGTSRYHLCTNTVKSYVISLELWSIKYTTRTCVVRFI